MHTAMVSSSNTNHDKESRTPCNPSDSAQDESDRPPGLCSILIIYDIVDNLERGEVRDLIADQETICIADSIAKALQSVGRQVRMAGVRSEKDVLEAVTGIDSDTTLIFNLCEAMGGLSSGEAKVPRLLERRGFQYTGSRAKTLRTCLNKNYTKACLSQYGIPTAPYQTFHNPNESIKIPLPAIVKPVAEDSSLGITRDSVVRDDQSLRRQVAYVLGTYHQPALVETFLNGREFNVSVWGNSTIHILPIAEIDFSAWDDETLHVVSFDAKWNPASLEYHTMPVLCPASIDCKLEEHIQQIALAAYKIMGCRDYARVDLREKGGIPYVLEVNPNPCLAVGGGFANAARAASYDYVQMVHQIAEWAWRRMRIREINQRTGALDGTQHLSAAS